MATLDDGQDWWEPCDSVWLAGHLRRDGGDDVYATLDLEVNGITHDNWTEWRELPESIKARLVAEEGR
jgi:hypothetical protein